MSTDNEDRWSGRRPRPKVGDTVARRIAPLRPAMQAAGMGLFQLSDATRDKDAEGRGLSWQLLAFLATDRSWGRETTTLESSRLIADALGREWSELFTEYVVPSRKRVKAA